MWYKAALSFGKAEGTVQCTYAIIYDKEGNKLFALQRKNFENRSGGMNAQQNAWFQEEFENGNYGWDAANNGAMVYTGASQEGLFYWDSGSAQTEFTDTGYLTIDFPLVLAKEWSGERLVPVTLLPEAVGYIKRTLQSVQTRRHREKWIALAERLNEYETFYVKPAAFNWHPIDVSIKTEQLKKAENDLNAAKAILAAAGVATII